MIDTCIICQHHKIQAINDAMDSGRYVGVIARQYRLDLLELERHRDHRRSIHGTASSIIADAPAEGAETQVEPTYGPPSLPPSFREWKPAYDPTKFRFLMVDEVTEIVGGSDAQVIMRPVTTHEPVIVPETAMDALQPALRHIRRASHLVRSYAEYQALVVEINDALCAGIQFVHEQLQHDDMGL